MEHFIPSLCERVKAAAGTNTPLAIHGGNTKSFYGGAIVGEAVDMRGYSGIIDYQPRELVLTVRAGTTLAEIAEVMDKERQMLAFEPPHFADGATSFATSFGTIGGTMAAGLSGPRRPYAGAVRDFVLGARIVNGAGDDLRFGGRVIKNVAGYDVSRLMCGALGTLGILTDLSFKVLPKPAAEVSLRFQFDEATAIRHFNEWSGQPLPISAASWIEDVATLRLSGTHAGVAAAKTKLGGDIMETAAATEFWQTLRDHRHAFFQGVAPLWRLSLPSTTPPLLLNMPQWVEWGGALRWVRGAINAATLREAVAKAGGHATLFRSGEKNVGVFHPLPAKHTEIHRNLKAAFDPHNILNRGRLDNF